MKRTSAYHSCFTALRRQARRMGAVLIRLNQFPPFVEWQVLAPAEFTWGASGDSRDPHVIDISWPWGDDVTRTEAVLQALDLMQEGIRGCDCGECSVRSRARYLTWARLTPAQQKAQIDAMTEGRKKIPPKVRRLIAFRAALVRVIRAEAHSAK